MENMKQIISSHKKTILESTKIKENKKKLATAEIKNHADSKASASKREWYTRQLWNRNPRKNGTLTWE